MASYFRGRSRLSFDSFIREGFCLSRDNLITQWISENNLAPFGANFSALKS